ncbi:MAG: hypothetical protein JST92_05155, partial [Deltaproteobacteria bacterium]|nr:hypothetical protein [Deltaproteobacteria bacterium]
MSGDGKLRQAQLLAGFGPGAMIDLPEEAVIVSGLEGWRSWGSRRRIHEERLEARLAEMLCPPGETPREVPLYAPPTDEVESPDPKKHGVVVYRFPLWFLVQVDETFVGPTGIRYRTRPFVHSRSVESGRQGLFFRWRDNRAKPVVPIRFVQACARGHISDVNWHAFVRRDFSTSRSGQLWLDEGGAGNDFTEIFVRDEASGQRRPLADAGVKNARPLGHCPGEQPWLGPGLREGNCGEINTLLNRSATNAYFSQTLSAIAIPDQQSALRAAIDRVYDGYLQYADDESDISRERRKAQVAEALKDLSDTAVWAEVARRKQGRPVQKRSIKQVEIETLLQAPNGGDAPPHGDFFARSRPVGTLPASLLGKLDRVVLVHRLREVVAQVGFTRLEAEQPDEDGELKLDVKRAQLAR